MPRLYLQYKKGPDLNLSTPLPLPKSTICSYVPECVYRKVEDELSVCLKSEILSCFPEKKLKLCICVWLDL